MHLLIAIIIWALFVFFVWWTLDHALIIRISSNQEGHCEACFEHVLVCWRTFPSVIVYLPLKIWHVEKAELVFCFYKRWSSIFFFVIYICLNIGLLLWFRIELSIPKFYHIPVAIFAAAYSLQSQNFFSWLATE